MLIASHRHTRADLELWAELAEADRAVAPSLHLEAKAAHAMAEIAAFAAGPCYASVSWGKDSVVMAHLLWRVLHAGGPEIPLYHVKAKPVANPHCDDVARAFLSRYRLPYWEIAAEYQATDPLLAPTTFDQAFRWVERDAGTSRYLSGIRAQESGGRRIRMRRWGLTSPNTCAPIGWWGWRDVFAYLAAHDLPTHPNYAMLGGGRWPREHLRVDELFYVEDDGTVRAARHERGAQYGRASWEEEYYGDLLRRLETPRPPRGGSLPGPAAR